MAAQVNGETHPSSATLQHIAGYPVINDVLSTFKKNPYGQKSIELGDSAYKTFALPFLPYFAKPYQYVSPYVKKADEFGDGALTKVDEKLPIITKPTQEIYDSGKQIVFFPVVKTKETKEHLLDLYNSEVKKVGGEGIVTYGKALISTGLVVTSEALTWIGDIIRSSKAKTKEVVSDATQ